MELVMYAGNDFIASLCVDPKRLSWPGYVSSVKRELLRRHASSLVETADEPEFFIVPAKTKSRPPQITFDTCWH